MNMQHTRYSEISIILCYDLLRENILKWTICRREKMGKWENLRKIIRDMTCGWSYTMFLAKNELVSGWIIIKRILEGILWLRNAHRFNPCVIWLPLGFFSPLLPNIIQIFYKKFILNILYYIKIIKKVFFFWQRESKRLKNCLGLVSCQIFSFFYKTNKFLLCKRCLMGSGGTLIWRHYTCPCFSYFFYKPDFLVLRRQMIDIKIPRRGFFIIFLGPPLGV